MFPIFSKKKVGVFAAFTTDFCGGLLHFWFFFFGFVQFFGWSGDFAQLHVLYRHCLPVYWFIFFFSAVICMVLCISNLGYVNTRGSHYTTCTFTGFTPSLFLHERPLNITKSVCTSPWCPTPLKSSCPSLHIWSSLWPAVLLAAGYTDAAFACVHCKYAHICVCVCNYVSHHLPITPHYLLPAVRRRWPTV